MPAASPFAKTGMRLNGKAQGVKVELGSIGVEEFAKGIEFRIVFRPESM